MSAKSHPASMRFNPDLTSEGLAEDNSSLSSSDPLVYQPSRCLIQRSNGELSLLDLDDGHEQVLTDSVELFWVTCGQSEEKENLIEEISWLDYGHRGMQVWYPSPGVDPFKQEDFLQLDPELEFDREVYPLGLLPNDGVVVGVSQRMSFSACTEFPCFEPSPQAQTILHCLLRHLLQRDKSEEALRLACLSAEKPHFSHYLEWLLFSVFDAEISRQSANKNQLSTIKSSSYSILEKTCDLIKKFPEYLDVVVSVARKTDGRHWGDLFFAAGRSTELFEECFQKRWYRTAACYILEYLQLERLGSARLDNFASGLELIGQKLQMGTLQSRLDAEFLLAHMCSVKFKEWIVVLATLLRRAEVLFDLFQHDLRLWREYSTTLQEYLDLLNDLEEQLSSVTYLVGQRGSSTSSDRS